MAGKINAFDLLKLGQQKQQAKNRNAQQFKCEDCEKYFSNKGALKTHRKFKHKFPTKRVEKSQNDESVLEVLEEKKEAKKKEKCTQKSFTKQVSSQCEGQKCETNTPSLQQPQKIQTGAPIRIAQRRICDDVRDEFQ